MSAAVSGYTPVIIVLGVYANELGSRQAMIKELKQLAASLGHTGEVQVVQKLARTKNFLPGTIVLATDLARLASSTADALKLIIWILARNGSVITQDGNVDLRAGSNFYSGGKALLDGLAGVGRISRSRKIRETFALAKERGETIGRPRISEGTIQAVLRVFAEVGSVRGTAKRLQDAGFKISRSACQNIIAGYKAKVK